jgi:hypothetical protein
MPHGVIDCCGAALLRLTAVYYAAKKRAKLLLISYLPKLFPLFSYFSSLFTFFAPLSHSFNKPSIFPPSLVINSL